LLDTIDPIELAAKLELLSRDAGLRERLGALGPAAVAQNDWSANFESTATVYERVISEIARQKK
jgi:hypothetical protein